MDGDRQVNADPPGSDEARAEPVAGGLAAVSGLAAGLAAMAVFALPWPEPAGTAVGLGLALLLGSAWARRGWWAVGLAAAGVWAGALVGHEIVPSQADEVVSIFDDGTVFAVIGATLLVLPAAVLVGAWLRQAMRRAPDREP